jgi:hypothetical protein
MANLCGIVPINSAFCVAVTRRLWRLRGQPFEECPQLPRREAAGPVEDLLVGPLDEDPGGGAVAVTGEEMEPPADGADVGVRLRLQIDVPPGPAARKLPQVQGRLAPGVAGRFRGAGYG